MDKAIYAVGQRVQFRWLNRTAWWSLTGIVTGYTLRGYTIKLDNSDSEIGVVEDDIEKVVFDVKAEGT